MMHFGTRMFSRTARTAASQYTAILRPQVKVCIAGVSRFSPLTTATQASSPQWASFLTHAEVAKRFEEFDLDADGIITVDECRAAMDRLEREISDGVVRESMWSWDSNKDGAVDYFEFMDHFLSTAPADEHADCSHDSAQQFESIEALLNHCTITEATSVAGTLTRSAKMELIKTFKLIDLDNDGFLSREELEIALKSMSPNSSSIERKLSLDNIFEIADKNSDGLIDLYEFSSKVVQQGLYG